MQQKLTLIIVAIFTVSVCSAADLNLADLENILDEQRFAIELKHIDNTKLLSKQYIEALDATIESLLKRGDPTPVVEARKIREAASASGSLPEQPHKDAPELVKRVQEHYAAAARKLSLEKEARISVLEEHYLNALEREMQRLTTAGQIEQALAVKKKLEAAQRVRNKKDRAASNISEQPDDSSAGAPTSGEGSVRTIPLLGTKSSPQWKRQLFTIPAGSFVKVTAVPNAHLSKEDMEHRCFSVKLGKLGEEKWFNTAGRHNSRVRVNKGRKEWAWKSHEAAEFEANQDDALYIMQTQDRPFTVTVEILSEKPDSSPSRRKRRKRD